MGVYIVIYIQGGVKELAPAAAPPIIICIYVMSIYLEVQLSFIGTTKLNPVQISPEREDT